MKTANIEIKSSDVVFHEPGPSQKVAFYICLLVGLLLLPFGFLLMLAEPGSAVGFFLAGFGLPFFSAALHIKWVEKKPSSFTFNNFRELFTVKEKNGAIASIGYGDIEDIRVRQQAQSSGDGPTTYTYVVYMQKKDGAFWDLHESRKEEESNELLQKIKKVIHLESSTTAPLQKIPDFISHSAAGGKEVFRWKDRLGITSRITVLCVFTGIGLIAYGGITHNIKSAAGFTTASAAFAFFILLGCYFTLKSLGSFHVVEVNNKSIKYGRGGRNPEKWNVNREVSIASAKSSQFSYTFERNVTNQLIYVMDEATWKEFEKFKRGDVDLSNVFSLIKKMMKAFSMPLYGFLTVDAMVFEQHLDEAIRQHGGGVL